MQSLVYFGKKFTVSTDMNSPKTYPVASQLPTFVKHHLRLYTYPLKT